VRTSLLVPHVVAGLAGLVIGPLALRAPKRPGTHTRLGAVYQWCTAVLCATAVGLAVLRPSLWWLGLIAAATEAAALGGWYLARRRPDGWLPAHVSLMCGSYVSFVTAFLVVNTDLAFWPAWILPTVVGSPLIARASARAARGATASRPQRLVV
jgi:hypothetical protein